jgi:broad specificity phosphatase PhoE
MIREIKEQRHLGMKLRLYLVRHGENPANLTKRFSCRRVDEGLTTKGILQARQTAAFFRQLELSRGDWLGQTVVTSPLKRAIETATIIANGLNLDVSIMEAFREIDVGDLEGRPATKADWAFHQDVMSKWIDGQPEARFPGGENYHELWARVQGGLKQLAERHPGQRLLIVGHGGIFTVTLRDLCPGIDLEWLRNSRWDNCGVTEIELKPMNGRLEGELVRFSASGHLHGMAAELIPGVPEDV